MMKKIVCKVCKARFAATPEARYTVEGKGEMFATAKRLIECFDCPRCGCQNTVNVRIVGAMPAPDEEGPNG